PMTRDNLLSLVSAPIIWSAHFLFCYVLTALACTYGWRGTDAGIALATAVALALLAWAAAANYSKWQRARRAGAVEAAADGGLQAFFALNSMLLCGVSAVALVWVAFPAAVLPTCAG